MKKLLEFTTHGGHPLARAAFPGMDLSNYTGTQQKHVHVVTTNAPEPKLVHISLIERFDGTDTQFFFNNLIQLKDSLSFLDCLVITTFYGAWEKSTFKKVLFKKRTIDSAGIKNILSHTNGYLLFHYQFECLAELTLRIPYLSAVGLRKHFNKQRLELAGNDLDPVRLKFFIKLLPKHLVSSTVHYPHYSQAENLFHHLTVGPDGRRYRF